MTPEDVNYGAQVGRWSRATADELLRLLTGKAETEQQLLAALQRVMTLESQVAELNRELAGCEQTRTELAQAAERHEKRAEALAKHIGDLHHVAEPCIGVARLDAPELLGDYARRLNNLKALGDKCVPVFEQSEALLRGGA